MVLLINKVLTSSFLSLHTCTITTQKPSKPQNKWTKTLHKVNFGHDDAVNHGFLSQSTNLVHLALIMDDAFQSWSSLTFQFDILRSNFWSSLFKISWKLRSYIKEWRAMGKAYCRQLVSRASVRVEVAISRQSRLRILGSPFFFALLA